MNLGARAPPPKALVRERYVAIQVSLLPVRPGQHSVTGARDLGLKLGGCNGCLPEPDCVVDVEWLEPFDRFRKSMIEGVPLGIASFSIFESFFLIKGVPGHFEICCSNRLFL
jgi:hypothetical protein